MRIRSKQRPKAIFISYRVNRQGNEDGHAGRVLDRLKQKFPSDVFLAPEGGISGGEIWKSTLGKALKSCQILIVLVTPIWWARMPELENKKDWVRREIKIALRRKITILVVRAGGTEPLTEEKLKPSGLEDLLRYQAATPLDYSGGLYDESFNKLTDIIERQLGQRFWTYWVTGLSLAVISALLVYWIPLAFPLSGFYTLLLACSLVSPALALWLWNRRWKNYSRGTALVSAFFFPAVLIALMATFLYTPVVVLNTDANLNVKGATNASDARSIDFVCSARSPQTRYARLWWSASAPSEIVVSTSKVIEHAATGDGKSTEAQLPNQCLFLNYESPFPFSQVRLNNDNIQWKGVAVYPNKELFDRINGNADCQKSAPGTSATLELSLDNGASYPFPLTDYHGEPVWVGNSNVDLEEHVPEKPAYMTKQGCTPKLAGTLWKKPRLWTGNTDKCGLASGGRLTWKLTIPPNGFIKTPQTYHGWKEITRAYQAVVLNEHN